MFNQIIGVTVVIASRRRRVFFALITVERVALYGVLKAIGASSRTLFAGVVPQAVVVTLVGVRSARPRRWRSTRPSRPAAPVHDIGRTAAGQRGVSAAGGRQGRTFSLRRVLRVDPATAIEVRVFGARHGRRSQGVQIGRRGGRRPRPRRPPIGSDEFVALVGPSGSGKTTLCSIAGGILAPTSGRVVVGGDDISGYSARELTEFRREMVGFVFQTVNLVPFLTARENLLVVDEVGRRTGRAARRRADTLLEELGLADRANNLPGQLSAARSSGWRSAAR